MNIFQPTITGSLDVLNGITGSLLGTASWANNAVNALTASTTSNQTTVGTNLVTQANPSAIRYLRINADNSVSQLTAAQLKSDLGFSRAVLSTTISQSTSTLADITGLGLSVDANSTYIGRIVVGTGCNNTGGVRFAFTFPVGGTLYIGATGYTSNNSTQRMDRTDSLASGTLYAGTFNIVNAQVGLVIFEFTLTTGANSGTFQPQYASGTNTQTSTIYAPITVISMEKTS